MMPDKVVFRESPLLWKMQDKNFPYLSCLRRVTLFINFEGNRPLEISNNPHSLNLSCKMGFIWMRTNLFSWQKLRSLPRIEKEAGSKWIWTLTGCDKINANNVTNFVVKWVSDKVIQKNYLIPCLAVTIKHANRTASLATKSIQTLFPLFEFTERYILRVRNSARK